MWEGLPNWETEVSELEPLPLLPSTGLQTSVSLPLCLAHAASGPSLQPSGDCLSACPLRGEEVCILPQGLGLQLPQGRRREGVATAQLSG